MPPRDPDGPVTVRVVSFNVWQGQRPDRLRLNLLDLIDDTGHPEVIALQEAHRLRGDVGGYRLIAPPRPDRDAATCFLVRRRGVKVARVQHHRVGGKGWTWNGNRRRPRVFPDITIEVDGRRFDLLGVHRTPKGPAPRIPLNRASWNSEHRMILAWSQRRRRRHPDQPQILPGDHNTRKSDPRKFGLRDLARRIGARIAVKGIDGALVVGARARARKLRGRYGSNAHRPVVVTVTANR